MMSAGASSVLLDGYSLVSCFCREQSIHGGVAIYCRDKHLEGLHSLESVSSLSVEAHCEVAAIECESCLILSTYRTPDSDLDVFLERMSLVLQMLLGKDKYMFVAGDFNVHFETKEKNVITLIDFFKSFDLAPTNFENTRGARSLDNVFTNLPVSCFRSQVVNPCLSDHAGICVTFRLPIDPEIKRRVVYRPIGDAGLHNLNYMVGQVSWDFVSDSHLDINMKFKIFVDTVSAFIDAAFPEKTKIITEGKGVKVNWFTGALRQRRETIEFLNDIYRKYPSPELKDVIAKQRSRYRIEISEAKKSAHDKFISESKNPQRAMWSVINTRRATRQTDSAPISATDFNDFFTKVGLDLIGRINAGINEVPCSSTLTVPQSSGLSFSFAEVSYVVVNDAITALKNTKGRDAYGMNKQIINAIRYHILTPLTKLINMSVAEGTFPDVLKLSKVIPLYKKGLRNDPNNYRPISITPVFGKIFEIVLKKQLVAFFEDNNIFISEQFGFRAGKSVSCAVNELVGMVNRGYDGKQFVSAEFLDLTKAFDCVSHEILLEKLKSYGVGGGGLSLISSYLGNRYQYVVSHDVSSDLRPLPVGVPQGSVLGPTLFLIFINDLPNCSPEGSFVLFADDTAVIHSHSDMDTLNSRVMDTHSRVGHWCLTNKLTLNEAKTETLTFTLRPSDVVDDSVVKFLGVYLDGKLTWENHVESLSGRMSRNIFLLRGLSRVVSRPTLLNAYYGLVHSLASYAILVWGHSAHASAVFGLQRRAVRIVMGLSYRADCHHLFKEMGILTVPNLYILQCLLYARKHASQYVTHSMLHGYNTRRGGDFLVNFHRLSKTRTGPEYHAIKLYNKIPKDLHALGLNEFKRALSNFLKSNPFYSLDEFYSADIGRLWT